MIMKLTACPGFKAAGFAAGIKNKNQLDMGLIYSEYPATVAGVFTGNLVKAAPVLLDQEKIKSGECRALIINSGNANCCTGEKGMFDAKNMCAQTATALGIPDNLVLVASTGVIGQPLPMGKISTAIPGLVDSLSKQGFTDLANSIMTTDTTPKILGIQSQIDDKPVHVLGVAKGSGMIHPNMATLLCFICTDVAADPKTLKKVLTRSVDSSFNRITVDGDTSTNDTALLMANGFSGIKIDTPQKEKAFQKILDEICLKLALMLVKDGEGVTKVVKITVKGAKSDHDARKIANTIAQSNLVKTAFFGEDANWGRIMAAAGRAGIDLIPEKIDIYFNSIQMVKCGTGCGSKAEALATAVLKKSEFEVILNLNKGSGQASVLTCDFSIDYVKINADYRS